MSLERGLSNRHVQLISIGGAIGTGLFLASGKSIELAGPSILLVYCIVGAFIFLIMRALGEILLANLECHSFVDLAEHYLGNRAGFITGWTYWFCWVSVAMSDLTATGMFMQYWFKNLPQWLPALIVLIVLMCMNLLSVKLFGELEFWLALIKILAIIALILFGLFMIITKIKIGDHTASFTNLYTHGGFFPKGLTGFILSFQLAVFSFTGVELVGLTAGETKDPEKVLPKAINNIPIRILLFYIGSLAIIMSVQPWDMIDPTKSPFVTVFSSVGIAAAATIINFVVISSSISACNSAIFSTSRMMFGLAKNGDAPKKLVHLNRNHVPNLALYLSTLVIALTVVLNYTIPDRVFDIVGGISTACFLFIWAIIIICHLKYLDERKEKKLERPAFRVPLGRWANYLTYAISGVPSSTNPINTSDRWGLTFANTVFSPLVSIDGEGNPQNVLADSVEPAADGKSVTVKLKSNVKWSDGKPLLADDVVFTYEQKAKKENGNADSLWIDDKPIIAVKVDDHTVRFDFPKVSAAAVNNIVTETFIIPKHIYKDVKDFSVNELKQKPVGTGPYKLVEYRRGEYIRFEANENYFLRKPKVKNLILQIIPSQNTSKVTLQNGEVDITNILPTDIKDLDKKKVDTYAYSENRVGYMGLNTKVPELTDVRVRQAILFALNKNEMNKAAYLSEEYYTNPYSFLPPSNKFTTTNVEKYETNIEKSKQLLKEAGVTGLKLDIGYTGSDLAQSLQATLIQQQLKQVGIHVELKGVDATALSAEIRKPDTTKYPLFLNGYIMGNDPDQYARLFKSGGGSNYFKLTDEKVDSLFNQGAVEMDDTKRHQIYDQLQQELANQAAIYPIVDNKKVLAVNNRVQQVNEAKLVPIYTFEDASNLAVTK